MKILSISQVRQADAYTIQSEPIASIDLMERAGKACYEWIQEKMHPDQRVMIFSGMGNNGGDGLVIARLLQNENLKVECCIVHDRSKGSDEFVTNLKRLKAIKGSRIINIRKISDIPDIREDVLVIDALIGSGLNRPAAGLSLEAIRSINDSGAVVISIDIPSGLFGDSSTIALNAEVVRADYTLSLQFPKLAFMFAENDAFVGEWHVIPIGLHPHFIKSVDVDNYLLEASDLNPILHRRHKFDHKGNYGHALLIAGSKNKIGAAILAARAALRSGVGRLTVHVPESGMTALHSAVPEAMLTCWTSNSFYDGLPDLSQFDAVAVGPGIGTDHETAGSLKFLIQNYRAPLILDADALNIIAENPTWISFLSSLSILTPHPGEFGRLVGNFTNGFEQHHALVSFTQKNKFITILKGAHSAIGCDDGYCFFNSTGNPGMATAGTGDVLSGIMLALKAQGYESEQAAILGTFLHGLAGDIAAMQRGYEGMIASDIIESIPLAFNELKQN